MISVYLDQDRLLSAPYPGSLRSSREQERVRGRKEEMNR